MGTRGPLLDQYLSLPQGRIFLLTLMVVLSASDAFGQGSSDVTSSRTREEVVNDSTEDLGRAPVRRRPRLSGILGAGFWEKTASARVSPRNATAAHATQAKESRSVVYNTAFPRQLPKGYFEVKKSGTQASSGTLDQALVLSDAGGSPQASGADAKQDDDKKPPKVTPEWAAAHPGWDAPCPYQCEKFACEHRRYSHFLPTDGPDSAVAKKGLDGKEANLSFHKRLINAYFSEDDEEDEGTKISNRVRIPAPFGDSSPPFPFSEHLGPLVGVKDESVWPLMEAIYNGPSGNWFKDNRIKVFGWVDPSVTFGTSTKSNTPIAYNIVPNSLQLSQAILIFERVTDSEQKDYCDWGFKFTNLYGIDYRYTTAKGYFSDQLLKHNNLYGYDPLQIYVDLYIPWVLDGMIIRAGRYISPIDIEAQLSPENYLYSHSTMYTYDPYTFTGIQFITQINKNWSGIIGVQAGNDMAPWVDSAQPNGEFLLKYVTNSGNDAFFGGVNSVGRGYYKDGHDDLQVASFLWTHKFNEKLHTLTEMYYLWERNALTGGTVTNGPPQPYFEAVGPGTRIPGLADAFGIVNYTPYKLDDKSYIVLRNDCLADFQGFRTGYATTYFEHTIGYVRHITPWMLVRPEIRLDYTDGAKAFDNGTKRDQFTVSCDVIIRF